MRAELAAFEAAVVERKDALRPQQVILPGARGDGSRGDVVPELGIDPAQDTVDDWLPDELAVVLGVGPGTASRLLEWSLVLTRQLPSTWAALADGLIDESRARMIVAALQHQKASFGGPVRDGVVDLVEAQALAWARAGVFPTSLRERVAGALIAADPAAADRRRKLRKRQANVYTRATGDGMAEVVITELPAEDAAATLARIEVYAQQWQADGDSRPIGQLRAETARDLVLRPWDERWGRSPVGAQIAIRVDLDDLEDAVVSVAATDATEQPVTEQPATERPVDTEQAATDVGQASAATDSSGSGDSGDELPGEAPGPTPPAELPPGGVSASDPPPAPPDRVLPPVPPAPVVRGSTGSGRSPTVDRLPISPRAVAALLARLDALDLQTPAGGSLLLEICHGATGALQAAVTPGELRAAAKAGVGLGPPPVRAGYTPNAAQRRFVHARDQSCRFPGCRRPARFCDADHVCAYDCGGATDCPNLCCLCRRHHRLKTHAPGWAFRMDPDGVLHVTTPTGITRTTRPPGMGDPVLVGADDPPPF